MKLHVWVLLAGACVAGPVVAQTDQLRPGLWEHNVTMKGGGQMAAAMAQAQQQLANMPADQRKMMEKMMADQGVSMGLGPKGNSVKVCMTKEDAARSEFPQQEGCTQDVKRNGSIWTVAFQCKSDPPTSGEGTVRLLSPTAYTGDFTMTTVVAGKPERMQMSQSGKWLAADCGALTPKGKR